MSKKRAALGFIFVTLLIDVIGFGFHRYTKSHKQRKIHIPEAAAYGGLVGSIIFVFIIFFQYWKS